MKSRQVIRVLVLFSTLLCAAHASADRWQNERYHLSMQTPKDWRPMSDALLADTNAKVSHVTGRGFVGGFMLRETNTLVFPYLLVQFKPYTSLPEEFRPQAKLDEQGQLRLLHALVGAFREKGPLPETIDTPQFIDQFGNNHARLTRLEDNGRFDFTGKIPHEADQDPIRYHTHGVIGKDGIAIVSVFTIDDFDALSPIIQNEMRTLALAQGHGMDALPDKPPVPIAEPDVETETPTTEPVETDPINEDETQSDTAEPVVEATPSPMESDDGIEPANPSAGHADSSALIIILSVLGVTLFVAVFLAWYITHRKMQARRERSRARRERTQAAQAAAEVDRSPRPASPTTAETRGSSDHRRHGKTRS